MQRRQIEHPGLEPFQPKTPQTSSYQLGGLDSPLAKHGDPPPPVAPVKSPDPAPSGMSAPDMLGLQPEKPRLKGSSDEAMAGDEPFPDPARPHEDPFGEVPQPEHVSTSKWQTSFYDATSQGDASVFKKLPSGPVDMQTGRRVGEGFQAFGRPTEHLYWLQV